MEQDKNKQQEQDKDMNKGNQGNKDQNKGDMSSENLDKPEFDIPNPERRSDEMTANENKDKNKDQDKEYGGGIQSGKTSSTKGGDQVRGGDETYSNIDKGTSKDNTGNRGETGGNIGNEGNDMDKNLRRGETGQTGIGTENRRGSDNMIDDSDEDPDTGSNKSGMQDDDDRIL